MRRKAGSDRNKQKSKKNKKNKGVPWLFVCNFLFFTWVSEEEAELLAPFSQDLEMNRATEKTVLNTSTRWQRATVSSRLYPTRFHYSFYFDATVICEKKTKANISMVVDGD